MSVAPEPDLNGLTLLTPTEMGAADRATIASGTPSMLLMERAGRAVADRAMELLSRTGTSRGGEIVVLCGPGNNGGDGYVAARLLAAEGHSVRVIAAAAMADSTGDGATAALAWQGAVSALNDPAAPSPADLIGNPALIIDAVFGAGLSRAVDGRIAALLDGARAAGCPCLAVDMPSGVDGETGQVRGTALEAEATVTFHRLKPGHLLHPGRSLCGPVHVADIGIAADALAPGEIALWRNAPPVFPDVPAVPDGTAHKYTRGLAIAVSGGPWQTGAIRLAAEAALRAGAGLVKIACPKAALPVHAAHLTAVMLAEAGSARDLGELFADKRITALLFGPGGGTDRYARARLGAVLQTRIAAVLDADAVTMMAGDAERLFRRIHARRAATVLTPHAGEFARLFPGLVSLERKQEPLSKVELARRAAATSGAIIVLKGPDTVIAAPDGRAVINAHASPWLATAGTGDVLAGLITGLVAQGIDPFRAACAGVWLHGETGLQGGPGLIAEDCVAAIPAAFQALMNHPDRAAG